MDSRDLRVLNAIGALQEEGTVPPYTLGQTASKTRDLTAGKAGYSELTVLSPLRRLGNEGLVRFSKAGEIKVYPASGRAIPFEGETIEYSRLGVSTIPRRELHIMTRDNLRKLEVLGFKFQSEASRTIVPNRRELEEGFLHSYQIRGFDPEGALVVYHRHETGRPTIGPTYVSTPHGRIRVTHLLRGVIPKTSKEGSSLKASKYYSTLNRTSIRDEEAELEKKITETAGEELPWRYGDPESSLRSLQGRFLARRQLESQRLKELNP